MDEPLARSRFDLPEGPLFRFKAYRRAWDNCLGRIKEVIHGLQQPTVDNIVDAVRNAYVDAPDEVVLPSTDLVTLLVSGSDRIYVHECLACIASTLCEGAHAGVRGDLGTDGNPGVLISRISESDCQNGTSLVRALIAGFISQPLYNETIEIKPSMSLVSYDMCILRAWYQAVKAHYGKNTPSLIVMIQDLQAINPIHLRDFFDICSCNVLYIPLIFLFGTSDPGHLHSTLPRSTLAHLRIERHRLCMDVKILEHVIRETFFSLSFTPAVMLGPAGFEILFKEFKRDNSTLDAVLSMLQLLHMQHFYNPLSLMVDVGYDTVLYNVLDSPSEQWKPFFQLLRQHYIPELTATPQAREGNWSELTPQNIVRKVVESRNTFQNRMIRMKVAFHILDTILSFVCGHGLKIVDRPFETRGLEALRGTLGTTDIKKAHHLVRQLKPIESQALLEELFRFVHNLPSRARALEGKLKQELVVAKNETEGNTLARFLDFLTHHLGQALRPFDDIACLDVWWTGEINVANSPLNPNPHISIVSSLLEPREYLGWAGSSTTEDCKESTTLPDACILFRRYVESGKMINVYDWYDSFSVALEEEDLGSGDGERMEMDETASERNGKRKEQIVYKRRRLETEKGDLDGRKRDFHARFLRSMHELEFTGFLRHTGRKADHVVKTVFDVLD